MVIKQYFSGNDSVYNEVDFERRFGVPRVIFNQIFNSLQGEGCFTRKYNCAGRAGIFPLVRLVACFRKLVSGDCDDRMDEMLQMSETAMNFTFKEFFSLMIRKFGEKYLNRCPTAEEKERCLKTLAGRGFPGMFASWDCKHFVWRNCPT